MKFLIVTPKMIRVARANKGAGILIMHPKEFLFLTTHGEDHLNGIRESAQSLEQYNIWAREGEIINMPTLRVSLNNNKFGRKIKVGQVIEHEGRHRAQSLIDAGVHKMLVAIEGAVDGYAKYKFEEGERLTPQFRVRYIKGSDFRPFMYGEFDPTHKVKFDPTKLKSFWSK